MAGEMRLQRVGMCPTASGEGSLSPRRNWGRGAVSPVISHGNAVFDEILCKWGEGRRGGWRAAGAAAFPWPQLSSRPST